MAFGDQMSYLPALSRLFGEVEQPTQTGQMTAPQFGGSPEQAMSFLQSPGMQAQLKQFGLGFDSSQMRQSPFLPNSFMQGHPMLGHMLSGAMANVAATPEAPLVSGAGSGMSRAMQGMSGGPEMLRQYQMRQMMAPMQAMGMMIPPQEFERKQQLLQLLTQMEQDRQGLARQGQLDREHMDIDKINATRPVTDPITGRITATYQQAQPGSQGAPPQLMAPGMPIGGGQAQAGQPGRPEQPAGWYPPPGQAPMTTEDEGKLAAARHPGQAGAGAEHQAKADEINAERNAGMPAAKVDATRAKAEHDRAVAGYQKLITSVRQGGGDPSKWSKQYNDLETKTNQQIQAIERAAKLPDTDKNRMDPATAAHQIYELNQLREQAKQTIDRARNAPGASVPYVSPGANDIQKGLTNKATPEKTPETSQGSSRAGGAGSNQSQGTVNAAPPPAPQGQPTHVVKDAKGNIIGSIVNNEFVPSAQSKPQ